MRLVVAILRREKLEAVRTALEKRGVRQATFSQVKGWGHEKGRVVSFRGLQGQEREIDRLKLEVCVPEASMEAVVDAIQESAHTGRVGDGIIWVLPLEQSVRIRTGEKAWSSYSHQDSFALHERA